MCLFNDLDLQIVNEQLIENNTNIIRYTGDIKISFLAYDSTLIYTTHLLYHKNQNLGN